MDDVSDFVTFQLVSGRLLHVRAIAVIAVLGDIERADCDVVLATAPAPFRVNLPPSAVLRRLAGEPAEVAQ